MIAYTYKSIYTPLNGGDGIFGQGGGGGWYAAGHFMVED
jgi:hypothetical protein